ncbi:phosphatase 2C catalytic subunit [Raphidocelis subcapitata]|uniref:protein-serine/threonine phosphatase n=1 Tax=Raphidocelis subcapitata TaxID=307507 RepID=A0A2V0NTG0_9CHLO|nr:phosphatase 2C catalytic subunit [Raphidocelis subcapitata]|eukprot:GBF90916.1 phosphatase 2C catalytic subunit [Raphidocelis subcapitata]
MYATGMLARGTAAAPSQAGDALVTGGEARSDGRASFGFALMRGKRAQQEDAAAAQWSRMPGAAPGSEQIGLFGVFDGHGGPDAAQYVRNNLFTNLLSNARFAEDPKAAITEAFEATDAAYLRLHSGSAPGHGDDGCTAITAALIGQRLLVANAGDSRAVLSRGGKAVPMSVDHKPNLREERQRIEGAGGVVVWAGTWRVSGVLAVSRAFGDRPLKRFVIPTPEVKEEALTSHDECLILASDGVWDVIANQEAVTLVNGVPDAQRAVRRLVEEAYNRGSFDNISAVVVKFRF